MSNALPQEFPRDLALLRLEEVLPELPPSSRAAYRQASLDRESDPLNPRGILIVGQNSLRPLMALMRLVVLRFRDLNLERFLEKGGEGRRLNAYVQGGNLSSPLPPRAAALFVESAEQVRPDLATVLAASQHCDPLQPRGLRAVSAAAPPLRIHFPSPKGSKEQILAGTYRLKD